MDRDEAQPEPGEDEDEPQRQGGADVAPKRSADGKIWEDEGENRNEDGDSGDRQRCGKEVDGL